MKDSIDVTYGGQIKALKNLVPIKMEVNYTVEGKTGKTTTTSFLIDKGNFIMVTFDYQELKRLIEGGKDERRTNTSKRTKR